MKRSLPSAAMPPPPPPPPLSLTLTSFSSNVSSTTSTLSSRGPDKPSSKRTRCAEQPSQANGGRSSVYRGVTRHKLSGRFEAHLWDKDCWNQTQNKMGRQVYIGAYDDEDAAAHTHDLAALKFWGPSTILNFPAITYQKEYEEMQRMTREEYLASLRRNSSGFARGGSKYRGVARHHHNGRWEARIGRVMGSKYLYLGTFGTQEEAAEAYDLASLVFRGTSAVTNFDINRYLKSPPNLMLPPLPPTPQLPLYGNQNYQFQYLQNFAPQMQQLAQPQQLNVFEDLAPKLDPMEVPSPLNHRVGADDIGELPWSLCLESVFDQYHVPENYIDNPFNFRDLFGDDFEDNIESLFEESELTGGSLGCGNGSTENGSSSSAEGSRG